MVKVIVILVIVVKRVFSLAKTIVVDVIVIYIPRIPVVFFVMGYVTVHINIVVNYKDSWFYLIYFLYLVILLLHIFCSREDS